MITTEKYRNYHMKNGDLLTIRRASHVDASSIFEIYDRAYEDGTYMLKNRVEAGLSLNKIINFIDGTEIGFIFGIYVAVINGNVSGFIECSSLKLHRLRHIAQFNLLVDQRLRRTGIGKKLVDHLVYQITNYSEIEKISASVHGSNKPAISLYELCGFQIEGVRIKDVKFEDGTYTDTVMMAKFL